jgi:lipid II:glycine glycyltransferase (peptidoglycan interpeptide bridge formation enzyme)
MDKYEITEIKSKVIWERFVLSKDPKSFLQSWNWGLTNELLGKKVYRLGIYKDESLVGVALVIKEIAKRGIHLLIPGGPIIEWKKEGLVKHFLKYLKKLAKKEKALFIRIRPELVDSSDVRKKCSSLGFVPAPMHLHAETTIVLDISLENEQILMNMRKSTRYLVRRSLRAGLILEISEDQESSKILTKLQAETVKRHKFIGFPEKMFSAQLESFAQDNQAAMFICSKGSTILAAAIVIFYGDYAYYHHSGSKTQFRSIPSSYYLQWKIIEEAKSRGCKYYNMWGIAPSDNPKHRFAGVTMFKKGFGGKQVDWLHAQDIPVSPFYCGTYAFEFIRRKVRNL